MTRIILTLATSLLASATLFASTAEACISCEYVPEVLSAKKDHTAKRAPKPQRVQVVNKGQPDRPAKKSIAKAQPAKKQAVAKAEPIAKAEPAAKEVETATAAPVETKSELRETPISVASMLDNPRVPTEEPQVQQDVGCKKFFPAVGMTLTVPCE